MDKRVEIIEQKQVFKQWIFEIEETKLRHEKYNGKMSDEVVRLTFKRGDSVAAVIHNQARQTVLLTEQFRFPTYANGDGWVMELPAGSIDKPDENPEHAMRREIEEEIGYTVKNLEHISTFYVSPGGTSERIHLFYASVEEKDKLTAGGGLDEEKEDIRTVHISVNDIMTKIKNGAIMDAKTIIGLQWLRMRQLSG